MKNLYSTLSELVAESNGISDEEYRLAGISKGLRKSNDEGILVGITNICDNYGRHDGIDCEGQIFYRGINLQDFLDDSHTGKYCFEEVAYLLLFGSFLEDKLLQNLREEQKTIHSRLIPNLERMINQETSPNLMNAVSRCVLNLYVWDERADDVSMENMIHQALTLITLMPVITVNAYRRNRLPLREPYRLITNEQLSIAENILYMCRGGMHFTPLEADILNLCLILHAELGGGNNSTFTTQVVASTGTDTYSVIAAAIGSIKGPKHGGANIKAFQMMQEIKREVSNWEDKAELERYLRKIIHKEAFDRTGLIYGVGHAVFTLSDPRTEILRELARKLSCSKGHEKEFILYESVERLASEIIRQEKQVEKHICANVDFYSGFIYDMLGIPAELFTPMFVNARIAGWCAHRLEEMCNGSRIIHPAFIYSQQGRKGEYRNGRIVKNFKQL